LQDGIKAVGERDIVDGMIGEELDGLCTLCGYVLYSAEPLPATVPLIHCGHHPCQACVAAAVGNNKKLWVVRQLDDLCIACTLCIYVLPLPTRKTSPPTSVCKCSHMDHIIYQFITTTKQQQPEFYGHYTGQPALAGTSS